MKKCLLAFALNIATFSAIFGQGMADQKMLPSADGGTNASLGNLFSPSLFDGSANVNIPIYTYKNDYGDFGISVNYNTKGVTVDEMSGPIGTHWNLQSGGSISHTVRDLPDEINTTIAGYPTSHKLIGRLKEYTLSSKASDEYWDGENDDYVVSAGNLNFTFKVGKNGYIFTYPESRAKITKFAITTGLFPDDYGFTIIDVDGTQYDFDVSDHASMNKATGNTTTPSAGLDFISKWKLIKVTFPNGQQIKYNYDDSWYPPDEFLYRYMANGEKSDGGQTTVPWQWVTASSAGGLYSYFLDSINYPNNVTAIFDIDQTPDPNGYLRSIKQIRIVQGGNCSKYIFNKSYLNGGGATATETPFDNSKDYNDWSGGRMVLKSIRMANCKDTTTEPYYSFEYSTTPPASRMSGARDVFGYLNTLTYVDDNNYFNKIPRHYDIFNSSIAISGQNKTPSTDVNLISALNLTKVKNAYGGSVTFQYEIHSGLANVVPNLPTDALFTGLNANDGVRIKSITTEDKYHPGNSKITRYTYSGGEFFLNGGYFSYPSTITGGAITEYMVTNSWVSPHQLINGSNHGYSTVTVETDDNNLNMLSKTVYNFTNFKDGSVYRYKLSGSGAKHYYEPPYTDKQYISDWEIGLVKSITKYDQNGFVQSITTNHYTSDTTDPAVILAGLNLNTNTLTNSAPTGTNTNILTLATIATDNYIPFGGKALLDTSIVQAFVTDAISTSDTATYSYDTRHNLTGTIVTNSKGEVFINKNVYNYTVIEDGNLGSLSPTNPLQLMYNNGIEQLVSTEKWKLSLTGSPSFYNDQLYDASIFVFANQGNRIWTQKMYSLRSLDPLGYTAYTGMSMGSPIMNHYGKVLTAYSGSTPANFEVLSEVLSTDAINNPTETQAAETDAYKAMIWDPITGEKLAEANCRLNEMAFSSFETTSKGNWSYDNNGVVFAAVNGGAIDGNMFLTVSGSSQPLSISGLTPNKEYMLTFWCKSTLPVISGGGLSNIMFSADASVSGPTASGWAFYTARFTPTNNSSVNIKPTGTFSTSYIDDARIFPTGVQMSAWNYTPLYGQSSSIAPNGRIAYFEYDAFGRQVIERSQEGNILSKKEYQIGQ